MRIPIYPLIADALSPKQALPGDAGIDLYTYVEMLIEPRQRTVLRTGISIDIPPNHFGLIMPRSSTMHRTGLLVVTGAIDATYSGEICASVVNLTDSDVHIGVGERLAQLIIIPCVTSIDLVEEDNQIYPATLRGSDGFGSTGV